MYIIYNNLGPSGFVYWIYPSVFPAIMKVTSGFTFYSRENTLMLEN